MKQSTSRPTDPHQAMERTSFQSGSPWSPGVQIRSDVVMCYGVGPDIAGRIAGWKSQGYIAHVMTGVSWGQYQDYLYGRFDGINHVDEAQTDRFGNVVSHGGDVYYMCPGENFGKFLCVGVQRAIDAGAEAIHLEEPEFWVRSGYSAGFKREWKSYYNEDWIPPHQSPDAQYRASLLKYYLYRRALKQVFDYVKDYNHKSGKHIRCYVATHSLINYASWRIVSPESSLLQVGADGFIAQIWTGTARTPNVYQGKEQSRTFESAFLEYGAMMNIVRASGSTVWFLNDPIEDNPDWSWRNYRANWESTLTASLLWPQVWKYEVMPWPDRIFYGTYPAKDASERKPGEVVPKEPIPAAYGTELMSVINALNDMKQDQVSWDCGTRGIGVVVSDTMMFQRGEMQSSDIHLGSFYGLALPLVKHGMPAEPVQLENAPIAGALKAYKVLLMTYEGMKPMTPQVHDALAAWVREGGVLVFCGDDSDRYNKVHSWWNTARMAYSAPREHLFERLGLEKSAKAGVYTVGKGSVIYDTESPAGLTYNPRGADHIRALARDACKLAHIAFVERNYLELRRGPYIVAAGLDESVSDVPKTLHGRFINLFESSLPVLDQVTLSPGSRYLLLDMDKVKTATSPVLAAAAKVLDVKRSATGRISFYAEGPKGIEATVRLALPHAPKSVMVDGEAVAAEAQSWDGQSKTLLIRFPNSASGRRIAVQ